MGESYFRSVQSMEKQGHTYRVDLLTKMYKKAKKKSLECTYAGGDSALPLKIHTQQGGRVYSAIATLLYASISSAKVDDLEAFIRKKGGSLPASIFDLSRWMNVLDVARMVRMNTPGIWNQENPVSNQDFSAVTQPDSREAYIESAEGNPFDNTSNLRTGESLEDDDEYELEFEPEYTSKSRDVGRPIAAAVKNNWMNSPQMKEGRQSLHFQAQGMVQSHSVVTESIKKDLLAMEAVINSAKQSLLGRLAQYQKAESDRSQAQSMRRRS